MLKLVPKNERKTQPANYRMMHNFCAFHLMYTLESNETLFPFRSTYFIITTHPTFKLHLQWHQMMISIPNGGGFLYFL